VFLFSRSSPLERTLSVLSDAALLLEGEIEGVPLDAAEGDCTGTGTGTGVGTGARVGTREGAWILDCAFGERIVFVPMGEGSPEVV
jgi:hypothetical protein